jgi:hypothetical protein
MEHRLVGDKIVSYITSQLPVGFKGQSKFDFEMIPKKEDSPGERSVIRVRIESFYKINTVDPEIIVVRIHHSQVHEINYSWVKHTLKDNQTVGTLVVSICETFKSSAKELLKKTQLGWHEIDLSEDKEVIQKTILSFFQGILN